MSDQTITNSNERPAPIPGIDAEATPLLGLGLGLTGLALGLRPRLAPLPLALTALAAALYRDPQRTTPDEPASLFAPADGTIAQIDEVYEHRFIHSDCLRITIALSPLDVPFNRSPTAGVVRYYLNLPGERRAIASPEAAERNERTYIGIEAAWGPILLVHIAGPLTRRTLRPLTVGDQLSPGERLGVARFGGRTDLIVQRDAIRAAIALGDRVSAGTSRLGYVLPLE